MINLRNITDNGNLNVFNDIEWYLRKQPHNLLRKSCEMPFFMGKAEIEGRESVGTMQSGVGSQESKN